MNNISKIIDNIPENKVFREEDVLRSFKMNDRSFNISTIRWKLFDLRKRGVIQKVGIKTYIKSSAKSFNYDFYSDESRKINAMLIKKFPLVKAAVWDEKILNNWLNLLLTKNIVFVEIEKEFIDFLYIQIEELFDNRFILVNPSIDELNRYQKDNIIVIKNLYSRSPIDLKRKKILAEKLIVDLICDKTISELIDNKEIYTIIDGIKKEFIINKDKLYEYAIRRNALDKIVRIWRDKYDR